MNAPGGGPGPGPQPGVNQLPTPPATLKVGAVPSFVTEQDFSRLMRQLEGCVDARLLGRQPGGDQVGYAEFSDKMNASKAKNLYHGWTGWGGRGLNIELTDYSMAQLTTQLPGQKRMREGEDLLQSNGNFKQPRPDMPVMGMAGGMGAPQQQQPQQGLGGQPGMQQPQQDAGAMGILQNLGNLTNMANLQQLLAAAQQQQQQAPVGGGLLQPLQVQPQQQGPGMMVQPAGGLAQGQVSAGGGRGAYESYNPAAVLPPSNTQQQPAQQLGGQYMPPQQQPQQQAQQYMPQQVQQAPPQQQLQYGMQQEQGMGGGYMAQAVPQQQQMPMMQPAQQQAQYGMAPQQQQPIMVQPGMDQVGGMMPQQQQPMMQQQPPQMMQPPMQQGMPMQGGRRGEVVAPTAMRQYPPDACNTLYMEGLPPDVTRRELSHIFRVHEGFRSLRLVIKDSKKHPGEKLVMAFAEYANTYFATEAMDALQGYPFDLDDPDTINLFVKYARPMENPRRPPPGGGPMMGGRGRGGPGGRGGGPPPDMHGGRGGGLPGPMGGRGGGRGGRYGPGGPPPRESPRGRDGRDPHY